MLLIIQAYGEAGVEGWGEREHLSNGTLPVWGLSWREPKLWPDGSNAVL